MKHIFKTAAVAAGLLIAAPTVASADDTGDTVYVEVQIIDFCGEVPTGQIVVTGADHIQGSLTLHAAIFFDGGEVQDVEGLIGKGGVGIYGFEYIDSFNEAEMVIMYAEYETSAGQLFISPNASFHTDTCDGFVSSEPVVFIPTSVTLPATG